MDDSHERTASLMTPAKLAQVSQPRAPVPPAMWLDQMAADAGHEHLDRLKALCRAILAPTRERDPSPLTAALAQLGQALPQLDFGLLQARGWLARATGKSRSAGAEFAAQVEQIDAAAAQAAAQLQIWLTQQARHDATAERTLVEFEVEYRAIDKVIDQGARWLQDMRVQLKTRQTQAPDVQSLQRVRQDAARCETLVARLKLLRTAVVAAQQAHGQSQAVAASRAALQQLLLQGVMPQIKAWEARLPPLAASATGSGSVALGLDGPMQAHRDLQLGVQKALAQGEQLRTQESALVHSLGALGEPLGTAR